MQKQNLHGRKKAYASVFAGGIHNVDDGIRVCGNNIGRTCIGRTWKMILIDR